MITADARRSIDIAAIRDLEFSAETTLADDSVRIKLAGIADTRAIEPLSNLLLKIHDEATRIGVAEVIVDLVELEFMSAPCFNSFVTWISTVQEAHEKYRVKFVSNSELRWQRRSLHALSCFATDVISIESLPASP